MTLGEMIRQYRKKTNTTMQAFSDRAGLSKGYVSMLEKNQNPRTKRPIMPSFQTMQQIAAAMDMDVNELAGGLDQASGCQAAHTLERAARSGKVIRAFGLENRYMELYEKLNDEGRRRAEEYVAMLAEMPKYMAAAEPEVLGSIIYYDTPVSAGTGQFMDSEQCITLDLLEVPPAGAEFVVRVCGDSMEPTYHDGDKLYVAPCQDIRPGEVGIFYVNGSVYVKERAMEGLLSHNPKYDTIYFHDLDSLRCYGKVLGLCKNYR